MRVLAHIDPLNLEREALRLLAAAVDRGERPLVLVPGRRLADHVRMRMLQARSAWLGVEIVDLGRLAAAILEREGDGPVPRPLTERLRGALVEAALRGARRDNVWRARADTGRGTTRRLRAAFDDLREAGIDADALAAAATAAPERDLAVVFRRYESGLDTLAAGGRADTAALAAVAIAAAPRFARRFGTILLHGASEVIGVHLDLVRALDGERSVTALVPAHRDGRGTDHSRRFAARHLARDADAIEWLDGDPARTERLAALYDEEARPRSAAPWSVSCAHAQGAAAEVRFAVRRELAAIDAGCPADEILLVVRDPATHLAALEEALGEAGVPWSTSARSPLRREPVVRDVLLLLRAVAEDFPRAATAETLRSPRLRWTVLTGGSRPGERLDRWSRAARLIGGIDEWREALPDWLRSRASVRGVSAERRERMAARLERDLEVAGAGADALAEVVRRLAPGRGRSWSEHAGAIGALLGTLVPDDDGRDTRPGRARAALVRCLDDMALLDGFPLVETAVTFERARAWLEDAVDGVAWAPDDRDRGGLRVLDAMQARGLTARRVVLLGMNSGAFPRRGAPDPILDDGLRTRLREATGRPLGVGAERIDEERGLLSLMIGAADSTLSISWQRSDESGRARSPSLALREVARATVGHPDPAALAPEHLSSHPLEWLDQVERLTGVLSADDEAIMLALRGRGPTAPELETRHPDLAAGLAMLRVTESFAPGPPDYDGRADGAGPRAPLSVSSLDRLGNCPLRFFFERVLRARELDTAATPWALRSNELGTIAHDALQRLYVALHERGVFDGSDPAAAARTAADGVAAAFDGAAGAVVARLRRRLPVLWNRQRDAWVESLRDFVLDDVARLVRAGFRPVDFERRLSGDLEFAGRTVAVTGRLDREFVGPEGRLVGDYKTSKQISCAPAEMLRGTALQVPLYRRLVGDEGAVELLRIGPGRGDSTKDRAVFAGFGSDELRADFDDTMGVLLEIVERGRYPLRHDERRCGYCPFDRACRHRHAPTVERERLTRDGAAYYALEAKQSPARRGRR